MSTWDLAIKCVTNSIALVWDLAMKLVSNSIAPVWDLGTRTFLNQLYLSTHVGNTHPQNEETFLNSTVLRLKEQAGLY